MNERTLTEVKETRMLGSYIEKLAAEQSVTVHDLSILLACTEQQIVALFKGRTFLSYEQLSMVAERLSTTTSNLLTGDLAYYNKHFVHCEGEYTNIANREKILDILEGYLNIRETITN